MTQYEKNVRLINRYGWEPPSGPPWMDESDEVYDKTGLNKDDDRYCWKCGGLLMPEEYAQGKCWNH